MVVYLGVDTIMDKRFKKKEEKSLFDTLSYLTAVLHLVMAHFPQ